jgi:hypothetical protein
MFLHAMDMWLDVINSEFWSFTFFMHAVHVVYNCPPHHGETHLPFTKFMNKNPLVAPHDFRNFGSPVYVLDKALQTLEACLDLENEKN